MKQKQVFFSILLIVCIFLLTACGPSAEEAATQTAAAWTNTPAPTATPVPTNTPTITPSPTITSSPTPTPVPFDASISVADAEGAPIQAALVRAGDLEAETDDSGMVMFSDLPNETLNLAVSAQGYFPGETTVTIKRGENSIDFVLDRDPFGLLPTQACSEGETLLVLDDFQDQVVHYSGELSSRIESGAPGVELIEDPEQPGNWVLYASSMGENTHASLGGSDEPYGDAVLRFRVRNNGGQHIHVGWHDDWEGEIDSRYIAFIYADQPGGRVDKFMGDTSFTAFNIGGRIGDGGWHLIEISTFEGEYQIWIDGVQRGTWADKQPILEGYMFLDMDHWAADAFTVFDDISVCGLSTPFTSIHTPE